MARHGKLDAARHTQIGRLIVFAFVLLGAGSLSAQQPLSDAQRLSLAQKSFEDGQWDQAEKLSTGPSNQSADFDFLRGLALARLQQWEASKQAFEAGRLKAPDEPRFLVELAGLAYKQQDLSSTKHDLLAALRLSPADTYSLQFLGTVYFLEGNLEAALKYWNLAGGPRLRAVIFDPAPQLNETLRERAVVFNAPQVLTRDALASSEARLDNLGIFSSYRAELAPANPQTYDLTFHMAEREGWGESKLDSAVSMFRGLPYATVFPEISNIGHSAVNFTSLLRWDSEKRRAFASISTPVFEDPGLRLRFYFDARNENWNLSQTFFTPGSSLTDLNMRLFSGGVELRTAVNGNWSWTTGLEATGRSFRNLPGTLNAGERTFFTDSTGFAYWLRVERLLLRIPERRFTLRSSGEGRVGRTFAPGLGAAGTFRGSLSAHWLPHATGDDYEFRTGLRAGDTAGKVPLDQLFQLGIERDNDLWLRGHAGTLDGRKGAAPLGRRYLLSTSEFDKYIYKGSFVSFKLGPFLDTGTIADSSVLLGSRKWLWDTGAQAKVRVLGSVTVLLSYGRDLRGGKGVFYGTTLRP